MKFALAGGTSPLAKDLADAMVSAGHEIQVFSRTSKYPSALTYSELEHCDFDVLVNLVGGHHSDMSESEVSEILTLSGRLVSVAIERSAPLVHLSSGAVLGSLQSPASDQTQRFTGKNATKYQALKMEIERLHESKRHLLAVSDLRLFSFAGPIFLAQSNYFLSKLFQAASSGTSFQLSGSDFLRDFTGPIDLASAIEVAATNQFSGVANLFSDKPVSRSEIVQLFRQEFGVNVEEMDRSVSKEIYCASKSAQLAGFSPRSSIEVVSAETKRAFALSSAIGF